MLEIILNDKVTTEGLGSIADQVRNPIAMLKVVGRRGANELKSHFRDRNSTPNKLGGRRTNFWRQISDSVNSPVLEGSTRVRISITDPRFVQKVFGGTIKPKNAKALTIPVDPLAYGRTVAVFQQTTGIQLFLLRKTGGGFSNLLAGFPNKSAHFVVYYVLVKEVHQDKDPEALPKEGEFGAALLDEAQQYLDRKVIRGRSGQGST